MCSVRTVLARLHARVQRELLPVVVEHAHRVAVPPGPDLTCHVFRRHRIKAFGHFDVSVSTDDSTRFIEVRETLCWKRLKCWPFAVNEQMPDMALDRSVDARVSYRPFPVSQILILLSQALKDSSFQSIILYVSHTAFDLTFGLGRQLHLICRVACELLW